MQLGFGAFCGVMIASGNAGQGKHQWNVSVAGVLRVALVSLRDPASVAVFEQHG